MLFYYCNPGPRFPTLSGHLLPLPVTHLPIYPHDRLYFNLLLTAVLLELVIMLQIYIESKLTEKCVRVRSGDRLGVYIEETPGAIAYKFKADSPNALLYTAMNSSEVTYVNDIIKFGSLNFPYLFSVLAYVDTKMDLYNDTTEEFPECPKGLRIPPYGVVTLPPTPPPTGKPGATGARGPAGIQGATGANGTQGEKGEVGSTGEQGPIGATGPRGFNGSVGATGPEGPIGLVGATGEKGDKGDVGDEGPMGPVGPQGPAGETITIPAPVAAEAVDEDTSMFSDPDFVMGLFIWLIILTILFIIILIVFICVRRRRDSVQRPKPGKQIVYSERIQSHVYGNDEKWMKDMKEETETNYSNNTLTADGTENDAQRPTSFDYTNECDKQFDYVNGEQVKAGITQC